MELEVGDTFRIIGKTFKPCKSKNKIFTVFSVFRMSHGLVYIYYYDYRTNTKCNCRFCKFEFDSEHSKIHFKTIHVDEVVLVDKKIQRERDLKLKRILK